MSGVVEARAYHQNETFAAAVRFARLGDPRVLRAPHGGDARPAARDAGHRL